MNATMPGKRFDSFTEFYPYHPEEHSHPVCRQLQYVGSLVVLALQSIPLNN